MEDARKRAVPIVVTHQTEHLALFRRLMHLMHRHSVNGAISRNIRLTIVGKGFTLGILCLANICRYSEHQALRKLHGVVIRCQLV